MPIYKRPKSKHWWVDVTIAGRQTRRSTRTTDRRAAEEFEHRLRDRLWRRYQLGESGAVTFRECAARWLKETTKRTKDKDAAILKWFGQFLDDEPVNAVTRDAIDELRGIAIDEGKSRANIDRYFAVLRAVLRKAADEWRYIEHAPKVPMFNPPGKEPRWLTREEFERLAEHLPRHLELAARFAVLTGLRMRSMLALTWDRIDLQTRRAWIPGSQMKAGRTHGLPLSREACDVLVQLRTLNPSGAHVFQWQGKPIGDCNTARFQTAVKAAAVEPLRWHDLRHTFASWALQAGVSLHELMQLGGWASYSMVLRYAHLAPDHLAQAAEKVSTNLAHPKMRRIVSG